MMYPYLVAVILIAAVCLPALFIATRPDAGSRCARPRKDPLVRIATALGRLDMWFWLASGEVLLPPAPYLPPIVTGAEVREEDERIAAERGLVIDEPNRERAFEAELAEPDDTGLLGEWAHSLTWSEDSERTVGVGWRVPDGWRLPGGRGLMFARPGKQPWMTAAQPAIPEPEPATSMLLPVDFPGDEPVPLARPYAPRVAYPCCVHCEGYVCDRPYHPAPCDDGCNGRADAGEAERLKGLMLP